MLWWRLWNKRTESHESRSQVDPMLSGAQGDQRRLSLGHVISADTWHMSRSSVHEWKEGEGILGRGDRMCRKPETKEFMVRLKNQRKASEAGTWKIGRMREPGGKGEGKMSTVSPRWQSVDTNMYDYEPVSTCPVGGKHSVLWGGCWAVWGQASPVLCVLKFTSRVTSTSGRV